MRISGDTLEPSIGSNITVPNGMGINVGNTEVIEIGNTGIILQQPYWNIVDEKPNNTNGGTFTSGDWRTRVLNTTRGTNSITGSSLSSNQFTLPAGTYRIYATAPAGATDLHKTRLQNITDGTTIIIGTSERCANTDTVQTISICNGTFTIASQKTFELQHRCSTTVNTVGFGTASNFGIVEIYTVVELWKLGN